MNHPAWPPLPLEPWEPTYLTLHRWLQIVGKLRLRHQPWLNHWWHSPLYVCTEGLTTGTLPVDHRHLTVTFDLRRHRLCAETSAGEAASFALEPLPVAEFYARTERLLRDLGLELRIWPTPVEVVDRTPFPADRAHAAYDPEAVERLHRILLSVEHVFHQHRGRFLGKSSPVHLFWGAFDLAVTRFSGRPNPTPPEDPVMSEAYSHEVISHGFWPGGDWPIGGRVPEAVFYAYAIPEPPGFRDADPGPSAARYSDVLHEFVLPYEAVRTASDPAATLLDFMESTYRAGATRGGWDVEALAHPEAALAGRARSYL